MRQALVISVFIVLCISCQAQSYFKHFPIPSESGGYTLFGMLSSEDAIYLSSKRSCLSTPDTTICLLLSKHELDGTLLWHKEIPWSSSANERNLSLIGDTLVCNGHNIPSESFDTYHLIFVNANTGDSIWHKQWTYEENQNSGTYSNGHVIVDDDIYMYGQTGIDSILCMVQHYRLSDEYSATYRFNTPIGRMFPAWDMVVNQDGNLAILNEIKVDDEYREVLVMSRDGEIIQRLYGPNYGSHTNVSNQMVLLDNGNYCFFHNIDFIIGQNTPQLISMNPDGSIDWTLDYPARSTADTIGDYEIGEMARCKNGDVLIVGQYFRHQNDPNWGRDVFIMRVSEEGEQLWLRHYNKPKDDGSSDMRQYWFDTITEMTDGSILTAGRELGVPRRPYFLHLDANGCHEAHPCGDQVILSTDSQDITWQKTTVSPNPISNQSKIQLPEISTGTYYIYDMFGHQVMEQEFELMSDLHLDMRSLATGNYVILIHTEQMGYSAKFSVVR